MLARFENINDVHHAVERIRAAIREPVQIGEVASLVEAAVGLALYPSDARDIDKLMSIADANMYADKASIKARGQ